MATVTKPDPKLAAPKRGRAKHTHSLNAEVLAQRAEAARKIAETAQRKAKRAASDQEQNRSTRTRFALKIKADALDQVASLLAARD